jgi:hypothetical protein
MKTSKNGAWHGQGDQIGRIFALWVIVNFGQLFKNDRSSVGVARWFIFKPKIPIWVNFGGP